jgi:hypothetical protein
VAISWSSSDQVSVHNITALAVSEHLPRSDRLSTKILYIKIKAVYQEQECVVYCHLLETTMSCSGVTLAQIIGTFESFMASPLHDACRSVTFCVCGVSPTPQTPTVTSDSVGNKTHNIQTRYILHAVCFMLIVFIEITFFEYVCLCGGIYHRVVR